MYYFPRHLFNLLGLLDKPEAAHCWCLLWAGFSI